MMHLVSKVFFLIIALVAINVGLTAMFNVNAFTWLPLNLVTPVSVVIGIIGVLSLVMFFYCGHCRLDERHPEDRIN